MQRCTNELYWLDQQAKGRMQYDWSDRNLDYPSRRRQYEVGRGGMGHRGRGWQGAQGCPLGAEPPPLPPLQNFINRNLEAKEERINKLHSEGDQLLAAEHPGRNSIEVRVPGGGMPPPGWPQGGLCCGPPGLRQPPRWGSCILCLSLHFAVFPSSV